MSDITINVKNDGMLGRIGTEGLGQKLIEMSKIADKQQEEIERLNNIINELEKYCNDEINEGNKALEKLSEIYNSSDTESYIKGQQVKCKHILDKIKELKENK